MAFAVVTDSTTDLTPEELAALDVKMVPLTVTLDGKEYIDQIDLTSEQFYALLDTTDGRPASAQPTPMKFAETFKELDAAGAEGILSIHIAAVLSGTLNSATLGAEESGVSVNVIDSCGATGFAALAVQLACKLRDAGVSADEATEIIKGAVARSKFYVGAAELDALLAGGRLAAEDAQNLEALNIRPVFTFNEIGVFGPCDKVRGMKGMVKRYVELLQERTEAEGKQRVRFFHSRNIEEVENLKKAIDEAGIDYEDAGTCPCGLIITTHLGVGSFGFACMPAEL